jgi:HlyD family secretion protein
MAQTSSRKKLYIIGGVAVVVLAVIIIAATNKKQDVVFVQTDKVIKKTITQIVSATGKIYPEVEVKVSPEISGAIIELPVKEGKNVKKGDLLFRIKPDYYKAQFEQGQASLSSARATSLQQKANYLKAQDDFKRAEELYKQKLISDADYSTAKTQMDVSKSVYESAAATAQGSASQLKQNADLLSKTTVYSPMTGTISLLNSELGETVLGTSQFAGTEVLRVADLNNMEVRINVNENDIVNVKLNDTARVSIDAYPDRKFTGIVKEIANTAKTTGTGTQEEVTNFEVKIRIVNSNVMLRPGMSATADIETKTVKDAVAVPIQCVTVRNLNEELSPEEVEKAKLVQSGNDGPEATNTKQKAAEEKTAKEKLAKVVFLSEDGKAKMVKVETGISDNTHIEIKSGLHGGEEVISGSYRVVSRELKNDSKVLPEKIDKKK